MHSTLKPPIGIENFEKLRTEGFYYVDKTGLIIDLLNNWGEVNLFTRPRRFGKSLNMNMLKYFFSYGCDPGLFDGLAVAKETELCEKYMGKFPVISVTLKGAEGLHYEDAFAMLCAALGREALRFRFLLESPMLSEEDKNRYARLIRVGTGDEPMFAMSEKTAMGSLRVLSDLLFLHYGQKVILLIDEYDVPLAKAQQHGYYDEMVSLIRGMFGEALKTNDSLQFAVLTGCLRISKESIFTGLNNLRVLSVTNVRFGEYFGFTGEEVDAMLEYYGLRDKFAQVREWYDGYRFGNADVYCPWDVINHVSQLREEPDAFPKAYWINSSGNDIIRVLLQKMTLQAKQDLERLVNGGCVTKEVVEELTYQELYNSIDNLWSVLLATGYLTRKKEIDTNVYELAIPNREIRMIFEEQVFSWFQAEVRKDTPALDAFCEAFRQGDPEEIERRFAAYLKKTIHIRDTAMRRDKKESFYHGILLGLLSHREDWLLLSNAESGQGYSDILVELVDEDVGFVVEIKYSESRNLEAACWEALAQIDERNYAERLEDDDITLVRKYGIACRKNTCMVRMALSSGHALV